MISVLRSLRAIRTGRADGNRSETMVRSIRRGSDVTSPNPNLPTEPVEP